MCYLRIYMHMFIHVMYEYKCFGTSELHIEAVTCTYNRHQKTFHSIITNHRRDSPARTVFVSSFDCSGQRAKRPRTVEAVLCRVGRCLSRASHMHVRTLQLSQLVELCTSRSTMYFNGSKMIYSTYVKQHYKSPRDSEAASRGGLHNNLL